MRFFSKDGFYEVKKPEEGPAAAAAKNRNSEEYEDEVYMYREHLKLFKAIEKLQNALSKGLECLRLAHELGVHFFRTKDNDIELNAL